MIVNQSSPWNGIGEQMPSWEEEEEDINFQLIPWDESDMNEAMNVINNSPSDQIPNDISSEPPTIPEIDPSSSSSSNSNGSSPDSAIVPRSSSRSTRYTGHFRGLISREILSDTPTYKEAMRGRDADKWKVAISEELNSLKSNDTFDVVPRPHGWRIVGSKFVLRIKRDSYGNASRYKARLVAQGFTQEQGIDYTETFAPVAGINTFLVLLAVAASNDWEIHQMGFDTAYLNAPLSEEVYMEAPTELIPDAKLGTRY